MYFGFCVRVLVLSLLTFGQHVNALGDSAKGVIQTKAGMWDFVSPENGKRFESGISSSRGIVIKSGPQSPFEPPPSGYQPQHPSYHSPSVYHTKPQKPGSPSVYHTKPQKPGSPSVYQPKPQQPSVYQPKPQQPSV
ncbi:vegetative cell wall protein gp1-like [Cyclopterus lumpus]|uniref:vegetative cell wall protein gp1-like n=1 Tax=Cyclopterus lumpus TaxID=8103 RepID=UPI0014868313|nr:vegetative cell wall protein gp1-like [Cyclopterus lumpus]